MKTDSRPFHFKHFSLFHHRSTMKVGTDAVLLGAWTQIHPTNYTLDVGTGCGIIPLMLAQRGAEKIDAVELHEASAKEAKENFAASQWRDHLTVFHQNITEFGANQPSQYDLIVSNPPFFTSLFKTRQPDRKLARHTDSLSFENLLDTVIRLLKPTGRFSLVLPMDESQQFLRMAYLKGFTESRRLLIIPVEGRSPNRINMELVRQPTPTLETENFTIRSLDGSFTNQYNTLLKDFYLGL